MFQMRGRRSNFIIACGGTINDKSFGVDFEKTSRVSTQEL